MRRALCAAIVAASGFLCTAADAQTCGLVKAAGYDMVVTKGGHIAINFQIGDETKLMVIDTGGFISTLSLDAVTQMNLKKREGAVMMIDAYGHKINEVAIAPTVTIGPLKIQDTESLVTSMNYDPDAAGALGPNVLRPFDIELDFAGRKVNFFTQDHCPGRVVYWTNSGSGHVPFSYDPSRHISFTSLLDGKEISTILDTGAPNSLISAPAAHQMYDLTTTSPGVDEQSGTRPDGTRWQAYFHRFNSLAIGAVSISNPILQILPDSVARGAQDPFANADHDPTSHLTPLVLGLRELQYLHMYISYKEKVIYVTDANAH